MTIDFKIAILAILSVFNACVFVGLIVANCDRRRLINYHKRIFKEQYVMHGIWRPDGTCSNCNCVARWPHSDFCPHCGARMDGKAE